MPKKKLLVIALVCSLIGMSQFFLVPKQTAPDTLRERVQKSGEMKCGYWIYEPYITKDMTTGELKGLTVDYLNKVAAAKGLKVNWVAELGMDQIKPALDYGKIDMFCVPCSPAADFEKVFDFVGSYGSLPYYLYVQAQSTKTKEELATGRFAVTDGYLTVFETPKHFPKATIISLPQISSVAEVYDQLKYGKADALVNEHVSALNYMRGNPETIRRYDGTPLFVKKMFFPIKKGETDWAAFINDMTDTNKPENKQIYLDLLKKYNVPEDALRP